MIRLLGFVGCIVFSSVVARADFVLDPSSVSGSFYTISNAVVAASDGPFFTPLDPVPGITGLRISGSADMVYVDVNGGGALVLEFGGQASGVIGEEVIHATLDYILVPHWSDPLLHGIYIELDLYFNQQSVHSSATNFLDTDADHPAQGSFAFDLSFADSVGTGLNDFLGRLTVLPQDFGQVGDGISLVIPDQSLDIGVRGTAAVPEPGSAAMLASWGLTCLWILRRRVRTRSQDQTACLTRA